MALLARLGAFAGRGEAVEPPTQGDAGDLRVTMALRPETAAQVDQSRLTDLGAEFRMFDGGLEKLAANGPLMRRTDLLVLEIDPANAGDLAALEQFATTVGGRIPVVAAASDLTITATRKLMRLSIADVLPIPFSREELGQALESGREKRAMLSTGGGPARSGNVIALQGALGGVGTSMIASQLAQIWAGDNKRVLLIDLDLQRGTAALYMNLKPRLSIGDLIEADERLDSEFLKMVIERHTSGASVIAAPSDMTPLDAITPEFMDRLLETATQNFDLVLLDLPGVWMDWTATAIQKADLLLLISQMTVSGVQQARRQIDVAEANGLGERVRVVMNRMVPGLFGKYDLGEAETALRSRVHFALANDYPTVSAALDEGRTLGQIKLKAKVERDLRVIAAQLSDELLQMGATA
ncbi:AAA family ATPase [Sandarakinorhabdus oryzae]|uniref:AAA family ATPase n=1 Tax=Sandarakinorhabdus oryzae TaxID=2675220 RepID=UPI0012E13E48|nr:AAA family ATPase [Sandarakinorhabdus oryzae]